VIHQWENVGAAGWRLDVDGVAYRVNHGNVPEIVEGGFRFAWLWHFSTAEISVAGHRTYKTSAGARRACEAWARRLGLT
jgi:hypothetical protein